MVGARAREVYDRQAKERQKGGKGGKLLPANLSEAEKGDSRDHVGKTVGVSGRTIDYATKVMGQWLPDDDGADMALIVPAARQEP